MRSSSVLCRNRTLQKKRKRERKRDTTNGTNCFPFMTNIYTVDGFGVGFFLAFSTALLKLSRFMQILDCEFTALFSWFALSQGTFGAHIEVCCIFHYTVDGEKCEVWKKWKKNTKSSLNNVRKRDEKYIKVHEGKFNSRFCDVVITATNK